LQQRRPELNAEITVLKLEVDLANRLLELYQLVNQPHRMPPLY
jgi:hypothetical protein